MPFPRFRPATLISLLVALGALVAASPARAGGEDTLRDLDFGDEVQAKVRSIEARARAGGGPPPGREAEVGDADSQTIQEIIQAAGGVRSSKLTTAELDAQTDQIVLEEAQALGLESAPPIRAATSPEVPLPPDDLAISGAVQVGYEKDTFTSVDAGTATTITYFESYQFQLDTRPAPRAHTLFTENLYHSNLRQANTIADIFDYTFDRHWAAKLVATLDRETFKPDQSTTDFIDQNVQGVVDLHLPENLTVEQIITRERRDFDVESPTNSSFKLYMGEWSIEKLVGLGDVKLDLLITGQNFDTIPTSNFLRSDQTFRYAVPLQRKVDFEYDLVREKENLNSVPAVSGDYVDNLNRLNFGFRFSPVQTLALSAEYEGRTYEVPDAIYLSYHRFLINPTYTLNQTEHTSYTLAFSQENYDYEDFDPTVVVASDQNYRDTRWTGTFNFQKRKMLVNALLALGNRHYPNFQSETQSDYATVDSSVTAQYNFNPKFSTTFTASRSLQNYSLEPTASSRTTLVALNFTMRL